MTKRCSRLSEQLQNWRQKTRSFFHSHSVSQLPVCLSLSGSESRKENCESRSKILNVYLHSVVWVENISHNGIMCRSTSQFIYLRLYIQQHLHRTIIFIFTSVNIIFFTVGYWNFYCILVFQSVAIILWKYWSVRLYSIRILIAHSDVYRIQKHAW
jgi:hypothetical protein